MRFGKTAERWRRLRAATAVSAAILSVSPVLAAAAQTYKTRIEPLLKNYCFDCHGDGANKGEVAFDEYTNLATHVNNQKLWLSVWQNLQTHMMPPAQKTQP